MCGSFHGGEIPRGSVIGNECQLIESFVGSVRSTVHKREALGDVIAGRADIHPSAIQRDSTLPSGSSSRKKQHPGMISVIGYERGKERVVFLFIQKSGIVKKLSQLSIL
jgi:hypothetical protein